LITQSGFGQLRFDGAPNEGWKTGKPWLDHLFNTYLEMLVRFGLAGALFALAAFGLLGKGLWHAHLEGRVPRDFGLFLVGSMLLMASWCFFEFRLLRPDWRSYWILIGGAVATFRWHVRSIDSSSIADTS
jgi:O-antigen ligase